MKFSRRSFFSRAGLATASAAGGLAPHVVRGAEDAATLRPGRKPQRIIHIVSDGMSLGTLTCADQFSARLRQRGLAWMELFKKPGVVTGMMNTRSLNSMVTDSAAASSAWGSGSRVVNGALNYLPDGRLLTPLYTLFAQKGWGRGLVTTAEITHATPAGFAAATKSRDNAPIIAAQYLENRIDVLLGGGRPFFDPAKRSDKRDLRADYAAAGYTLALTRAELLAAPPDKKVLGLFADSHLPYTIDQLASGKLRETVPTLAEMTRTALAHLERQDQFILQVEGARIDHAAHNSDAAAAFHDQMALDEALEVCLEFQRRHPETLIVATTDHGNSNPGINGMGGGYELSTPRFSALKEVRCSFPEIIKRLEAAGRKLKVPALPVDREDILKIKEDPDKAKRTEAKLTAAVELASALQVEPKQIIEILAEATGYRMSERRAVLYSRVLAGEYQALYDQMNSPVSQLGQVMANRLGIGWTGNTHTGDYVPVLALGPGAEHFAGFYDNTALFSAYTTLAGIDFKNPSVPLTAAGPAAHSVEKIARYTRVGRDGWA